MNPIPYSIHEYAERVKQACVAAETATNANQKRSIGKKADKAEVDIQIGLSWLKERFLTPYLSTATIPFIDSARDFLDNKRDITPFVTVYMDYRNGRTINFKQVSAFVAAYACKIGDRGIGYIIAGTNPHHKTKEATEFLDEAILKHSALVTDYFDERGIELRGWFIGVHKSADGNSYPSRSILGNFDATEVSMGTYVSPFDGPLLHGEETLFRINGAWSKLDAQDLHDFLQLCDMHRRDNGMGVNQSINAMISRAYYMAKSDFPLNSGQQSEKQKDYLARNSLLMPGLLGDRQMKLTL